MRGTQNSQMFLEVEGALYYERDTKFSEPNALNTPSLVTVGPNSCDDIAIMMSGAEGATWCVSWAALHYTM